MKNPRNVAGYAVIGLGGAAFLVGMSPVFPVFLEAFLVGGTLIAAGLWILAGKELRALFLRAAKQRLSRGAAGRAKTARRSTPDIDPLLPVRILRLARQRAGSLTVSQAAIELDIPLDHAEAGLEACVRTGSALPDYDVARGHLVYRFPEFTDPDSPDGIRR